jgi:mono/diheme cytochrome c family protein
VLRSIAELAAYGTLAALLTVASLAPQTGNAVSSATTESTVVVAPAPAATSERGALLFATKGCIGCHTHALFPNARMQVGPNLTGLPDRAATRVAGLDARAYVRQSLRDPEAYRVPGYQTAMPDLHLSDAEIDALTAFLLSAKP